MSTKKFRQNPQPPQKPQESTIAPEIQFGTPHDPNAPVGDIFPPINKNVGNNETI